MKTVSNFSSMLYPYRCDECLRLLQAEEVALVSIANGVREDFCPDCAQERIGTVPTSLKTCEACGDFLTVEDHQDQQIAWDGTADSADYCSKCLAEMSSPERLKELREELDRIRKGLS